MHASTLLDLSTELLRAVLKLDQPADGIVSTFFRKHRELGHRERHALAETAYAVLRRRLLFQHLAQSGGGPLERRLAILAWQGTDSFLRTALQPAELTWLGEVQQIDRGSLPDKLRHNLPDWLAAPLQAVLGEQFWPLVQAMSEKSRSGVKYPTFQTF